MSGSGVEGWNIQGFSAQFYLEIKHMGSGRS
jgi:hypothetical protein